MRKCSDKGEQRVDRWAMPPGEHGGGSSGGQFYWSGRIGEIRVCAYITPVDAIDTDLANNSLRTTTSVLVDDADIGLAAPPLPNTPRPEPRPC